MLVSKGKPFLVVIRESLLGYLEARALVKADSTSITKFFFKEVIYRYRCPIRIKCDSSPKNKLILDALAT